MLGALPRWGVLLRLYVIERRLPTAEQHPDVVVASDGTVAYRNAHGHKHIHEQSSGSTQTDVHRHGDPRH
jgi:hypothetical protein